VGWSEQTTTWQAERTIDGFVHVVRMFRVWDATRQSILDSPQNVVDDNNIGLPSVGSRISGGSDTIEIAGTTLKAYQQVIRTLDAPTISDVEYRYSNDPRLIASRIEYSTAFQTEYMTLPISQKSSRVSLGTTSRSNWIAARKSFPYTVGRLMFSVLINEGDYFAARTAVRAQINKLHILAFAHAPVPGATPLYRFEGGDFTRYSPSFYMARYSWWLDGGHGALTLVSSDVNEATDYNYLPPQNITFYNNEWSRPPYHELEMYKQQGSTGESLPGYVAYLSNEIEEDGWLQLVGI